MLLEETSPVPFGSVGEATESGAGRLRRESLQNVTANFSSRHAPGSGKGRPKRSPAVQFRAQNRSYRRVAEDDAFGIGRRGDTSPLGGLAYANGVFAYANVFAGNGLQRKTAAFDVGRVCRR